MQPSFLTNQRGQHIAYEHCNGNGPGVMFLCGLKSDMQGNKATALRHYCQQRNQSFTRCDYSGHGMSDGNFIDGTISQWLDDADTVFQHCVKAPVILVGSSMGGWIMLHLVQRYPHMIHGMIGIAAAPDFTHDLMWESFNTSQREALHTNGHVALPSDYDEPYIITKALIDDGREQCLLDKPSLDIGDIPLALVHGMNDIDVPWQTATRIALQATSRNVHLHLIKDGDHRLSREEDIIVIHQMLERIMAHNYDSTEQNITL